MAPLLLMVRIPCPVSVTPPQAPPAQPANRTTVALALGVGAVFGVLILIGQILLAGQIFNSTTSTRSAGSVAERSIAMRNSATSGKRRSTPSRALG